MLDFHQKRKLRTVANARVTQAVLLVLVGFVFWHALERYVVASDMADRRASAEQTAAALQARKEALEVEVRYLQDERGIEAEMRRQFDVALPGEEVVVILEDEVVAELLPLATSTPERSWWQIW